LDDKIFLEALAEAKRLGKYEDARKKLKELANKYPDNAAFYYSESDAR
jgi:predicted Zn-dependent protease